MNIVKVYYVHVHHLIPIACGVIVVSFGHMNTVGHSRYVKYMYVHVCWLCMTKLLKSRAVAARNIHVLTVYS